MNLYYILAAVCVLYFFGLLLYCGTFSGFYCFWLLVGACFFVMALAKGTPKSGILLRAHDLLRGGKEAVPLWCKKAVLVLFFIGLCSFCAVEVLIVSQCFAKGRDGLDYIIVLGAGVRPGGVPSNALKKGWKKHMSTNRKTPIRSLSYQVAKE